MVALTKAVVRGEPFHSTIEFVSKPVPVRVMVAACPAGTICGEIEVSTGVGLVTVKGVGALVPPPGAGFCTATAVVAELPVMAEAGSVAFSSVALTHKVASAEPFHTTVEEGTKPVPVRSSVCAADPATTLAGSTAAITGGGLLTAKLAAAELPPPGAGLNTVIAAVPPSARSVAGTVALRELSVENVVASAVPFQRTADPLTKPVPETAIESCAAPAVVVTGVTLLMVGTALSAGAGDEEGDDELVPPHPFASRTTRPRQAIAKRRKVIRKVTIQRARSLFTGLMRQMDDT
jgi:hypothetical protein